MPTDPKVSVVMTAYSNTEFIPAAIESIFDQQIESELVLVDDGSTEDVPAVIAPYRDRLRYIRRENGGLGPARDTGVEAATGEYVAFCDSDDIHLPYRLSAHAALLDIFSEAGQVFSDLATYEDGKVSETSTLRVRNLGADESDFDGAIAAAFGAPSLALGHNLSVPKELEKSKVYHGKVPALIAGRHVAWGGASMFRRAALLKLGGHDPSLLHWEDWNLISRLSKRFELIFWDAPVLWYRQHGGQLTKRWGGVSAKAYRDVVFSVWKNDPLFAADHPRLLRSMIKLATSRNVSYATEAKEYSRARADILEFIRAAPLDRHGYTSLARNLVLTALAGKWR